MGSDVIEQRGSTVAVAILVGVLLIAPRSAAGLVFALALVPLAWMQPRALLPLVSAAGALPKAALLFGGYMAISIVLSLDRIDALGKTVLFFGLAGAVAVAAAGFGRSDGSRLKDLGRAALTGFSLAIALLFLEEISGHAVKNGLYKVLPVLKPDAKHVSPVADGVVGAAYLTNRSIAMMTVMLGPMLLTAWHVLDGWARAAAMLGLPAIVLATALASQHESSQLGLIAAGAVLIVGLLRWRLAFWLVVVAWVAANALVVPAVKGLYAMNLHLAPSIPFSAKARVILWNYTAEQVPRHLLLGVGLSSTRVLDDRRSRNAPTLPGHVYPQRTGPHAHNIYLQTWYELGVVGVILFTTLGLALIAAMSRLADASRPYALATFTGTATIGAFSWGLWQPWFMAMFAVAALLVVLADAIARSGRRARRLAGAPPGRATSPAT